MNNIFNAQITSTWLGKIHGCLTAELFVECANGAWRFGGYCLDNWYASTGEHDSNDGYGAIIELMKTLEVSSWEELKDRYVRVETDEWGDKVLKIGHIIKNQWFSFEEYFEKVKEVVNG